MSRRRLGPGGRVALAVCGVGLIVAPLLSHRAPARAAAAPGSNLGGYKVSSTAAGLALIYNDGSEAAATLPDAETDFGTGTGHALAADFYPGPVLGNPGATIQQFLGADLPSQVVGPLGTLQDNVKAEAYSGGPNDATFPVGGPTQALADTAHADPGKATANGTVFEAGGGTISAASSTVVTDSSVTTTATSTDADLDIGGIIHVARVTSTATASSNGATASATGSTTIAGLTIAGVAISVDGGGVTVGPGRIPVGVAALANPALAGLGLSVTVSGDDHTVHGAQAVEHAPAVTIFVNPPNNGGNTFTVTLGGADARAQASPAFVAPALDIPPPAAEATALSSTGGADQSVSPGTGSAGATAPASLGSGAGSAAPVTPPAAAVPGRSGPLATAPIGANFGGVPAGLIVLGLIAAACGAFGLGKISDDVLGEHAEVATCPIERGDP